MNTLLLHNTKQDIQTAATIIRDGGVVGVPTETVYGLAADALNGDAVSKIFKAKGRPMDNPLIVHISDTDDIEKFNLVAEFCDKAKQLAQRFWPGPLTIIMKKSDVIPDEVSAGLGTVAIRLPSHPIARQLIRASGTVLAAPSANKSGSPSPTALDHVLNDLSGKIDAVIDGGTCDVGIESTVITLADDVPRLLRPGYITVEMIEDVIGHVDVDSAVLYKLKAGDKAASPGMKYKHYSPHCQVILVDGSNDKFVDFVNSKYEEDNSIVAICYDEDVQQLKPVCVSIGAGFDEREQARCLFDALRRVDNMGEVTVVYAHCPKKTGVGMALYNRLIRAAGFEVVSLD